MAFREPRLGGGELVDLRDAVVSRLRLEFPDDAVPTVVKHRGAWTAESVKLYSRRAPALIVIMHGSDEAESLGNTDVDVDFEMSCVAMCRVGDSDADDACLAIVRHLVGLIPMEDWDIACVSGATKVQAQNLYSGKLDGKGVNMWAVSWMQRIILKPLTEEEIAALPDFLRAHMTYDLEPDGDGAPEPEQQIEVRE